MYLRMSPTLRRPQGDGVAAVKLGIVPVHLGQGQCLPGQESASLLHLLAAYQQGTRHVHARVGAEEVDAPLGVEQVSTLVQGEELAPQRRIIAATEELRVRAAQGEEVGRVHPQVREPRYLVSRRLEQQFESVQVGHLCAVDVGFEDQIPCPPGGDASCRGPSCHHRSRVARPRRWSWPTASRRSRRLAAGSSPAVPASVRATRR